MTEIQSTLDKIEIMKHFANGGKIEFFISGSGNWVLFEGSLGPNPLWNWGSFNYRKVVTKPSIDWSHVAPEYKWLAMDDGGRCFLYKSKPQKATTVWNGGTSYVSAHNFQSLTLGACDWKDSLVERDR